jgi:hypothetical protein
LPCRRTGDIGVLPPTAARTPAWRLPFGAVTGVMTLDRDTVYITSQQIGNRRPAYG